MEYTVYKTVVFVADYLDFFRARVLRLIFLAPALKEIFKCRATRLFTLFLLSFTVSAFFSLSFPLWLLVIGPIFYGPAHLVSSLRYFFRFTLSCQREQRLQAYTFYAVAFVILIKFASLFLQDSLNFSEWQGSNYLELLATSALFVLFVKGGMPIANIARGMVFLIILILCSLFWPLQTIGALILIHNFVGFLYWGLKAKRNERLVVFFSFFMALGFTVLILSGKLDSIHESFKLQVSLPFASLYIDQIGKMIFSSSSTPLQWFHLTVAYAFGQSLHYFVWLKAIPDQLHRNQVPSSFRQSLALLYEDFGTRKTSLIILYILLATVSWMVFAYPLARSIYFVFAAFHGYLEILGLLLVFSFQNLKVNLAH